MNRSKWILLVVALALMAGGAALLLRLKSGQRLGNPGLRVASIPGSLRAEILLPESLPGWVSSNVPPTELELAALPQDTSLAKRAYKASDGFQTLVNVVMMGTDRTSIHKPEYCLTSQGWSIVQQEHRTIAMTRPHPYLLPVRKFTTRFSGQDKAGQPVRLSGVFAFWFVAENRLTSGHWSRMGWITWELLRRGVLPRWAYVTYFSACAPGEEAATFARMERFIELSVPEFQTATGSPAPAKPGGQR